MAAVRQRAGVPGVHVGASRARSCCSWAAISGSPEEWNHDMSVPLGSAAVRPASQTASAGAGTEPAVPSRTRRCTKWTSTTRGFEWVDFHDGENSIIAFIRRARRPGRLSSVLLQLYAGSARELSIRRAGGRILRRDPEYRFRDFRRQQYGQRWAGFNRTYSLPRQATEPGLDTSPFGGDCVPVAQVDSARYAAAAALTADERDGICSGDTS